MIIYKITNLINGKIYIGQTNTTLKERFKRHCRPGCHALYNAIKKYGKENFSIEQIDVADTQTDLDEKEILWIENLNSLYPKGYNIKIGGRGGRLSEDTKRKIGEANTGNVFSEESRETVRLERISRPPKENCSSKYKGVKWDKSKRKWCVSMEHKRKYIFLGRYDDEVEAAKAYDAAVWKYRDGKGYLNFPGNLKVLA